MAISISIKTKIKKNKEKIKDNIIEEAEIFVSKRKKNKKNRNYENET